MYNLSLPRENLILTKIRQRVSSGKFNICMDALAGISTKLDLGNKTIKQLNLEIKTKKIYIFFISLSLSEASGNCCIREQKHSEFSIELKTMAYLADDLVDSDRLFRQ